MRPTNVPRHAGAGQLSAAAPHSLGPHQASTLFTAPSQEAAMGQASGSRMDISHTAVTFLQYCIIGS